MKTKEKITKLIDDLHNKVDNFYNSDEWAKYLQFALKFRNRSEFNKLLIWFYGGEDTVYVMGYKQCQHLTPSPPLVGRLFSLLF